VSGRSSGVERNLAKVDVVSSNLIARSILPSIFQEKLEIDPVNRFQVKLCFLTSRRAAAQAGQ
tara:strand:- start:47469 stop:47657 length:189 start_codon:yes stop_codon:yes gene_type:complete